MPVALSPEQEDAAKQLGSVYVRACPGAGKTRTLVARAVRLAETLGPLRGVALLSFTKSAADEFKERLVKAGAASLLKPPHFVGTIDSFLTRFVVVPRGNPWAPDAPVHLFDSWQRHSVTVQIGRTVNGRRDVRQIDLSAFRLKVLDVAARELSLELDLDHLARVRGAGLAGQIRTRGPSVVGRAEHQAKGLLKSLLSRGQLTPSEIRLLASAFLRAGDGPSRAHVGNLVQRFPVLIVDEAQDCDGRVLELLARLAGAGAELTLIADPDQCIYAWRGAKPQQLAALSESWGPPTVLTGNYRSSPNICAAASSLKEVPSVDKSKGESASCSWPVFIAPLKSSAPSSAGRAFLQLLNEYGIEASKAIVLAHSWSLAMAIAGAKPPGAKKQRLGGQLRSACFSARERADVESLKEVRELVEKYVASRTEGGALPSDGPRANEQIDAEVRRLVCEVLLADPHMDGWHTRTLRVLETLRLPADVALSNRSSRKCLPRPGTPLAPATPAVSGLAYATVHQAKGREYDAVLYAAGRRVDDKLTRLMKDWADRRSGSERRAVAYVGVTRAARLLLFVTPAALVGKTEGLLRRDGAMVELLDHPT